MLCPAKPASDDAPGPPRYTSIADSRMRIIGANVEVWWIPLSATRDDVRTFERILAPDELARADRFAFVRDRTHFIAARAALRSILGHRSDRAPHSIRFDYGPQGKPSLAGDPNDTIYFNMAHSGDRAVVAVSSEAPVGIDIERISPEIDVMDIATHFFSPVEIATLARLGKDRHLAAFFKCWTSKEAYIKALGQGLSIPLQEFDVCVDPDCPARLLRPLAERQTGSWFLHDLRGGDGYRTTIATRWKTVNAVFHDFSEIRGGQAVER
jgi:4'-phosphopantetheinyl transferase